MTTAAGAHGSSIGRLLAWWILLLVCAPSALRAAEPAVLEVGTFSAAKAGGTLPEGWKPLTFKKVERQTRYELVAEDGTVVVKATSQGAASGLIREVRIDPKVYPIIRWRWKVANVLAKGDITRKEGDDYPARLYITFEYDPKKVGLLEQAKYEAVRLLYGQYPPLGALNYIWDGRAPKGTLVANAYTARAMMIVVESGTAQLNQWVSEERNLYEDYQRAFGEEPPPVSGVAIMTDTDDTGETATAYYGDIVFARQR
ncbi:DUF3047 domain-containing protein [Nitrospira sp. Kam-Ns4a]